MTLQEFHDLLLNNSGVTTRVLNNFFDGNGDDEYDSQTKPSSSSFFFQPYASKADPFSRSATLVTGPVVLAVLALELALAIVYYALKSIGSFVLMDTETAADAIGSSATYLIVMVAAVFAVVISPVVNAIDLIGGGIASLSQDSDDDSEEMSASPV